MKVILAVCTFRRPDGLERLLRAVAALDALPRGHQLHAVVVDNDAGGEGLATVHRLDDVLPFPVRAVAALEPGLSAARNRAVKEALRDAPDLIVFLDDDEWPEPGWLNALLAVQARCDSDAVGGPTRSVFPAGASPAQTGNAYYGADMGLPDGAPCVLQAGGNVLVRASALAALGTEPFDPAFARSGGEDLAFFTALARRGARMHWARDAVVSESVPAERLAPGWMRQRVINIANSRVRVMQRFDTSLVDRLERVGKTLGLGGVAALLSIVGVLHAPLAERARLLRWKFIGKWQAHRGRATVRQEAY